MAEKRQWEIDAERAEAQISAAVAALAAKGVRLKVAACGCCDSPWVKVEVDGVVLSETDGENIDMFKTAEEV